MIGIIDNLVVLLSIILVLITIALGLACALRVTRRRRTADILDRRAGEACRAAGDPFRYPFGEMPTVPPAFGRAVRTRDANNFRNWGIPSCAPSPVFMPSAAVAHRRNESGGRPASRPGTAVVLTFPTRRA